MIDHFLGDLFGVLYCSAVLCSVADTHLKLLEHAVSGVRFLTGGVLVSVIFLFLFSFSEQLWLFIGLSKTPPQETFFTHLTVQSMGPNHP